MASSCSFFSSIYFNSLPLTHPAKQKSSASASRIETIPQELWVHQILTYLDPKTLCRIAIVCKRWNIYVNHDVLWKRFLLYDYKIEIKLKHQSLKLVYKNLKMAKKNTGFETNKTCNDSVSRLLANTYYFSNNWENF